MWIKPYKKITGKMYGSSNPTSYKVIKNTDKEDERFRKFLYTIFNICELSGFRIEGRIVLIDKVTGKVYR